MKLKYIGLGGVLFIVLVLIFTMCSKEKHLNIFEEIYHDEYSHATGSWRGATASTLESIPDMKIKNTRELLFGITEESYKEDRLPRNVNSINYTFNYPDGKLVKGSVSIFINLNLPDTDILQVEYMYQYHSNQLIQKVRVFSEFFENEYSVEQYMSQKRLNVEAYTRNTDEILKDKLIADWLSVYPSKFSIDNWGDVKIVNQNLSD